MSKSFTVGNLLFNVEDTFGKQIRITRQYWKEIKNEKHKELEFGHADVIVVLKNPDEVRLSVKDDYIRLFYKRFEGIILVVVVKYLNGDGFVVTVYQTSKVKRKGEIVWSKEQKQI